MEYGLDWRHLHAWVIFSRMDMMGMIWTSKAHVKKSIVHWVMWIMHLFCVSDWCVVRWGVPVTSCSLSRWRMEAGERILSRVSRGAMCKAKIPRSITPAGLCWVWWLSGNTSMVLSWQSCRSSTSFHKLFFLNMVLFYFDLTSHVFIGSLGTLTAWSLSVEYKFWLASSFQMETGHK